MAISLKPEHLKRYKDIALLLVKYGRSDLVKSAGLDATIEGMQDVQVSPAKMEELAADIEKMGPTFIKLAQLLSTRADLLPQPYIDALTMEYIRGKKITSLSPLAKIDLDGYLLAEHLFQAYM